MRMRLLLWVALMGAGLVSLTQPCQAFIVYDPSNWAQNAMTAKNSLKSLINQAIEIKQQLEQLRLAGLNTAGLSHYESQTISQLIEKLDNITQQGDALSYAMKDVSRQFNNRYPDYVNDAKAPQDFQKANHQWSASTLDTLNNTLQALQVSGAHFQAEEALLSKLRAQGEAATGRLQALQVSTEMTAETVNQLQELKRLLAISQNADNAYRADIISKASYETHQIELMSQPLNTAFPSYHADQRLGLIPVMREGKPE